MTLDFAPFPIHALSHDYLPRLRASGWEASDYSPVNLWGWGREYELELAWHSDLIWIRQSAPRRAFWAPVGNWDAVDWARELPERFPGGATFVRVPERLRQLWSQALDAEITVTETPDQWDYLYSTAELIELKGNKFHKKKNLLSQFLRGYDHVYAELTSDRIHQALEMQEDWCVWRDCESEDTLAAENRAINRVLSYWDSLPNLLGGVLFIAGRMAAFTVAEEMPDQRVLIHFEKGLTEFKGIYQAINQMFLAANPRFAIVNREQDMGDPGLRKAKASYNPVDYVRKYEIRFR